MVLKCPRCGGKVAWSMGEWECIECGYKFKIREKETLRKEEIISTVTETPKEERIMEEKISRLPAPKLKPTKWLIISIILLIAGIFSGYALGIVFLQPEGMITKTIFIPQTVQVTETYTETQVTTQTVTTTSTVTLVKQIPIKEEYLLKIIETVVDTVSEVEYNYYIVMLEAIYNGGKSWNFNILFTSLLSDTGYKYNALLLPVSLRQPLGAVELKDGERVKGQVAFKIPKDEEPLKLLYEDELTRVFLEITDIPKPRGEVSYIYLVETEIKSDYSYISVIGEKKTPGIAFYSGEEVEVELNIKYARLPNNPLNIDVTSITVENFEMVEIDPNIPLSINDGEEVKVRLILKVPEKGYSGNLKITVTC
ncbi:MAG: DUF4352 domain-containing protein [Nitrososphaeria archaeon]|nr:DUF4352 domain-containing protein [Nitrososphaeria archaeon]